MNYIIEMEHITKRYKMEQDEFTALDRVNLQIRSNEMLTIVGRSGSGKSTLLNIIGGLDTPTAGRVSFKDKDIFAISEHERTLLRRKNIGFIFQSYNLIPVLTVRENIELPQLENDSKYVDEIMQLLGIYEKRNSIPAEISGGQQQRTAIARALVNKPDMLLADEPTGNLDSKSEQDVLKLFRQIMLNYKTTVVIVTHNLNIAKLADRVIEIEDGKIVE